MHMVMVSPNGNSGLIQQLFLLFIDLVGEILKPSRPVLGGVKRGLMDNQQIRTQPGRFPDHIDGGNQGRYNACAFRLGIAAFPVVAAIIIRQIGVVG